MPANISQYLPFAAAQGANVYTPAQYAALTALLQGIQNGIADAATFNTAWRQATMGAATLAKFTADFGPNDVNDDGNLQLFENNFVAALQNLFEGVQFLQDVSLTPNTIAINPSDPALTYSTNMIYVVRVKYANISATNNGATVVTVSGLAPKPLVDTSLQQLLPAAISANGLILISFDGNGVFQLLSGATINPSLVIHWGKDVSLTVNQVVMATDADVIAYGNGPLWVGGPIAITNTGAADLNANGLGFVPMTRGAGTPLSAGDLVAGTAFLGVWDGAEVQVINPQTWGGIGGGSPGVNISQQLSPYWIGVLSASTTAPPGSPNPGDLYLIPPGATGAWSSLVGKIGQWTGSAWVYVAAPNGYVTQAGDTQQTYTKTSGGWTPRMLRSLGAHLYLAGAC